MDIHPDMISYTIPMDDPMDAIRGQVAGIWPHEVESVPGAGMCAPTTLEIGGKRVSLKLSTRPALQALLDAHTAKIAAGRAAAKTADAARRVKERMFDAINNEGGEGYNPYRGPSRDHDRTPYHKGDDWE